MKKGIVIGIFVIAVLIIAGFTTGTQQSPLKQIYKYRITECEVIEVNETGGGLTICDNHGYTLCIEEKIAETTTYYNSSDRSCKGSIQAIFKTLTPRTCGNSGTGGAASCIAYNASNMIEPYAGDVETRVGDIKYVTCCK